MNPTVGPRQLDAIREIVNIGAGHAATNLSTLTGLRVMISVPRIQWVASAEEVERQLPPEGPAVSVEVPIVGGEHGRDEHASLILSRETALRMVMLMLRRDQPPGGDIGPLERSALLEMGNIVCAAYVGVLGDFLGRGVMIGAPSLEERPTGGAARHPGEGLLIETDFGFPETTFEGLFVLSHADVSFSSLLDALGLSGAA